MAGALYPGTFDPFTNGHEEIVRRSAAMFGRVVIAVADNSRKDPAFSLEDRLQLIRAVVADSDAIEVVGYSELTVSLAREHNTHVIVRGLRSVNDFEYEFQLATMNRHLAPEVETVFLTPAEGHAFISSTLVREVAKLGGDIADFVHPTVASTLKKRFSAE